MQKMLLGDICKPKQWKTISTSMLVEEGYPVYGANGIIGKYSKYNHEKETLLITCRGATCGKLHISVPFSYINGNAMALDDLDKSVDIRYLYYYLKGRGFKDVISGSAQPQIIRSALEKIQIDVKEMKEQRIIVELFTKIEYIMNLKKQQLEQLDDLIKARFVEMFGDLKSNSKGWEIVRFNDCAKIDTNMIHEFKDYQDYPHIGIDCIEKETGRLIGYKTVLEDGVISGKYLFTPKHIIYSKIRPNLNKVALPNFSGLCSADAYPILVKEEICNREFLGYTLRSQFFLDYILTFSNRTNLPKVNKNQVEGFTLPLPPIEVQNQFSEFVKQVDKSKFGIRDESEKEKFTF